MALLSASSAAATAMTAASRKLLPKVIIDLIDPDIIIGNPTSSGQLSVSLMDQLYNKVRIGDTKYATGELNRWILDGTWQIFPDNPSAEVGEIGYIGDVISNADGIYTTRPWVQLNISGIHELQASSVAFTGLEADGYGVDFTFSVYSGNTVGYTQTITSNTDQLVAFEGFTVTSPTAIRITFSKWSLPGRHPRAVEIIPGVYEEWTEHQIYTVSIKNEVDLSCMSLPYGTCTLEIWNKDKRFNPRNKNSIFQSIEEREKVPTTLGIRIPSGAFEYLPTGTYFQQNGGWATGHNGMTMLFNLIDIIGLTANRKYAPPGTLPTTVDGWVQSIVSQLGNNFSAYYIIDNNMANTALTCTPDDVSNIKCGDLLRFVCMAINAFPRADATTGYLRVSKVPASGGITITFDNMSAWPIQKANDAVASITFKIYDSTDNNQYIVSGTTPAAEQTLSVSNPFIHTTAQADVVAANILKYYGGQQYQIKGRGNLRSEMGDVDAANVDPDYTGSGWRYYQELGLNSKGIMSDVASYLLQSSGLLK